MQATKQHRSIVQSLLIGAMLFAVLGIAIPAFAQVSLGFPSSFIGLGSQDLRVTIANIVRIILGFVGLLFVLLIMYGGWVWMTSQGMADKINRAKKIIAAAVIGLLIILSAYAIASFVVTSLQNAVSDTGGTPGAPGTPVDPVALCLKTNPGPGIVKICSVTGGMTPGSAVTIRGHNFETYDGGTNSKVFFWDGSSDIEAELISCSGSPIWSNSTIRAIVPESLGAGTYEVRVQTQSNARCDTAPFSSNPPDCRPHTIVAGISPSIYCIDPESAQSDDDTPVPTDPSITITGRNFGTQVAPARVEMESDGGRFSVPRITSWAATGDEIVIQFPDDPPDATPAITGDIVVFDSADQASNGVNFTVTCSGNGDCGSACCSANQCVDASVCAPTGPAGPNDPVITSVNPNDGAPGNYVTIRGRNFGITPGILTLVDSDGTNFVNPQPTNPLCTTWWRDRQIIMEIPRNELDPDLTADNGATTITVTNTIVDPDLTSAPWTSFRVDDTLIRPGLCRVEPAQEYPGNGFVLNGNNFTGAGQNIFFGNSPGINATSQLFPDNENASATVPNLTPGDTTVAMTVGGQTSNPLDFRVLGQAAGDPIIQSFSPQPGIGPTGTYVTIIGSNFGNTVGRVFMRANAAAGNCSGGYLPPFANDCLTDLNFPPMCGSSYWTNSRIVVKIPASAVNLQSYFFVVERATDQRVSQVSQIADVNGPFTKDDSATLNPGLCRVDPVGGPAGTTEVNYYGENFGPYDDTPPQISNVWFTPATEGDLPYSWNNTSIIGAGVPDDAVTGETYVENGSGGDSNAIPFFVGSCTNDVQCGGSALCCSGLCREVTSCEGGNYAENNWEFWSGQEQFDLARSEQCSVDSQTPSPFPYEQYDDSYLPIDEQLTPTPPAYDSTNSALNAPLDVVISARFNRPLDFESIIGVDGLGRNPNDNGVRIYQCTAGDTWGGSGTCGIEVTSNGEFAATSHGFTWDPDTNLLAGTWYEVRLDDGGSPVSLVRAQDNSLYEGSEFLGANEFDGNTDVDDYRWHFRTRDSAQPLCEISNVTLTPGSLTVPVGGTDGPMRALPTDNSCYICGGTYTYEWEPDQGALSAYANYSPDIPATDDATDFEGVNVTPAPVPIRTTLMDNPSGTPVTSGPAQLNVDYMRPYVLRGDPNASCRAVCTTAAPTATLADIDLEPTTVTPGVNLYSCVNSACAWNALTVVARTVNYDADADTITLTGAPLAETTWYRVILRDTIENTQGQGLTRLNFDANGDGTRDSYSWTFQTSYGVCEADDVLLTPLAVTIPSIGAERQFTATPVKTDESCRRYPIDPGRYVYVWGPVASPIAQLSAPPVGNRARYRGVAEGVETATVNMTEQPGNPDVDISETGGIAVIDSRDSIDFIGHRPDTGPQVSPPEYTDGDCDLNGAPGDCAAQCRNVLVSALFSTYIDRSSVTQDNFSVREVVSGAPVPGTFAVRNYIDSKSGVCTANPTLYCTPLIACPGSDTCNYKRGRVDFIPNYNASTAPADYVARYSFNNDSGGVVNDDSTPSDHDGASLNVSAGSGCVEGSCYRFNPVCTNSSNRCFDTGSCGGAPCGQQAIRIDDAADGSLDAAAFTFSAWAMFDTAYEGIDDWSCLASKQSVSGAGGGWALWREPDQNVIKFNVNDYGATDVTASFISGRWYHWTGVYDGSQLRLYRNGVLADSQTYANPIINVPQPLSIGACQDATARWMWAGQIDDAKYFNRALSAGEVAALARSSIPRGAYLPGLEYEVNVCEGTTCTTDSIRSTQGVAYLGGPRQYSFATGDDLCRISYVEVYPDPANFYQRRLECRATDPLCTDPTPKNIIAQARDANGTEIGLVQYDWQETVEGGESLNSPLYTLEQDTLDSSTAYVRHKATVGVGYNFVTARSSDPLIDLGSASAQGRMNFSFCENPWIGQGASEGYLDDVYDIMLTYCRDAEGQNLSDPLSMLPALPNPHLIRQPGTNFTFGGDLLKEHVFVVGSTVAGTRTLTSQTPQIRTVTGLQPSYRLGDFVYLKVDAVDPDGDSFLYTVNDETGDPLPASASFNQRTGIFTWYVDQVPVDDGTDAGTVNDFEVTFGTSPTGTSLVTMPISINVEQGIVPTSPNRPDVEFTTATWGAQTQNSAEGRTITVDYGATVTFNTNVTSYGLGATSGIIKSFVWDFQDSGLSSYPDTTPATYQSVHTFVQPGVHQVTFRVQNSLNVWSPPAVMNVIVRPKTSMIDDPVVQSYPRIPGMSWKWLVTDVTGLFTRTALGQGAGSPPDNLTGTSIDNNNASDSYVYVQLAWTNAGSYSNIRVYRNNTLIYTSPAGDAPTRYLDNTAPLPTIGTDYVYRVCGVVGVQERCSEITVTARRVDYDIIIARIYKNVGLLSIREWYEAYAPNPTGSPTSIMVDGYPAIQDGTSIYVGMANCSSPTGCTGNPGVYANVLLLSYNAGASESTGKIFAQLLDTIRINYRLLTRDDGSVLETCSGDTTISCVPGHDATCQAKNAGLCRSAQAELRRDHKRIVDLHAIRASLNGYASENSFCNDGTNTRACNTDRDCPSSQRCVAAYPALSSGTYIGGITTSQWPSWDQTFAKELKSASLPVDPINRFGANFYANPPASCLSTPIPSGHDEDTCWNERTLRMQCHRGSEVYVYKNRLGTDFNLYANAEASGWRWYGKDPNVIIDDVTLGGLCSDSAPVTAVCGNGVVEGTEACDGGFRNYCDLNFGEARWNTDFTVGCRSDCNGWGAPVGADITWCNGACNSGICAAGINVNRACGANTDCPGSTCTITVDTPYEQCDGSVTGAVSCTAGGSAFCSSSCQLSCTEGRPYSGACGNGSIEPGEVCDDGTDCTDGVCNGAIGSCNASCSGYGSFCGDGVVTPIDTVDKGCACDTAATAPGFCSSGYRLIQGSSCSLTGCTSAHTYSCVRNVEECDMVVGLTSYSCPEDSSLYCDTKCNRACTQDNTNTSVGERASVAIYEHYYNVGNDEDSDYTRNKVADANYATRGIVFYGAPFTSAGTCPAGTISISRYRYDNLNPADTNQDTILRQSATLFPPTWNTQGVEFCAYSTGSATDPMIVPIYEWGLFQGTAGTAGYDTDYRYTRTSSTVPMSADGVAYARQNVVSGVHQPRFWARLGPLQETCGNDIVEGLEECEPGTYTVPTAETAKDDNRQYQCGALFTPNACRMYGGYCGDGTRNEPFERCDEGISMLCSITGTACQKDGDCPGTGNTCVGNGAPCNNNGGNCTYCTKTCSDGFLARNYCGDGVQNPGLDNLLGTGDAYEEVCDNGANNGKEGYCNETCSGGTGAVCGNNVVESGEVCDNGVNNGKWTDTCTDGTACSATVPCTDGSTCGSGTPRSYCSFSCLGQTVPYCGDGIAQRNAGPDGLMVCQNDTTRQCSTDADCGGGTCNADGVDETCDFGAGLNGQPGSCNATCTGLTAGQCGNDTIDNGRCAATNALCDAPSDCAPTDQCIGTGVCSLSTSLVCQNNAGCPLGETCTNIESCDPPAPTIVQQCTDTIDGMDYQGLRNSGCSATCSSQSTQCHAFGLKIWSDGIDVAYLNGRLMLLGSVTDTSDPQQCPVDSTPSGADYADTYVASPPTDNVCVP